MIRRVTDFPFIGAREYLHGTSIVAAVAELLEAQGDGAAFLKRLKFQRPMRSNGVLLLDEGTVARGEMGDAACVFSAHTGTRRWRGAFVEEGRPVAHRLAVRYDLDDVACEGFGGRCVLRARGREEFIRAFVEANKQFHLGSLRADSTTTQVRFGSLEDWDVVPAEAVFEGVLEAQNLISQRTAQGLCTINRLTFHGESAPARPFTLCFDIKLAGEHQP
jgi:hypothetical protein